MINCVASIVDTVGNHLHFPETLTMVIRFRYPVGDLLVAHDLVGNIQKKVEDLQHIIAVAVVAALHRVLTMSIRRILLLIPITLRLMVIINWEFLVDSFEVTDVFYFIFAITHLLFILTLARWTWWVLEFRKLSASETIERIQQFFLNSLCSVPEIK